jgi:hypothetical protein
MTSPAALSSACAFGRAKSRLPFPVPFRVYDETIRVMRAAVQKAELGQADMFAALKRLDGEARRVEDTSRSHATETLRLN